MKLFAVTAFLVAIYSTAPPVLAGPSDHSNAAAAAKAINAVPPLELPSKAAQIVANAPPAERNAVAAAVMDAVTVRHPASASVVAGTLARTSPGLPAVAAHNSLRTTPNPNSHFDQAPPHGGFPPGLYGQPGRHGPPEFVDYSRPRSF